MTRTWQLFRRLLQTLFGRWEPPAWLSFIGGRLAAGGGWARAHRAAASAVAAGLLVLSAAGIAGYRYWKNRPQPEITRVLLTAPAVTPIEDKIVPRPLVIDFERAVAPLQLIHQEVARGIELQPKLEGSWKWASDKQLVFTPKQDWPVGQTYAVQLSHKDLVVPRILLDQYELSFSTAAFEVRLSEAEFYQDPVDPHMKKVVATFSFTHPVEPASFEQHIKLHFAPSNPEDKAFDPTFHVTYDKHKGQGFVHSAPFPLPRAGANVQVVLTPGTRAARGGPAFGSELSDSVRVPGLYDFFHVQGVEPEVVDNAKMEPEQVLIVSSSGGVSEQALTPAISAYVLPEKNPLQRDEPERDAPYYWSNPEQISPEILQHSRKLALSAIPTEREFTEQHSFRFNAEPDRFVYVQVKKGVHAFGGYILGETFQTIVRVPQYPKQLKLLSSGSLLALSGSRKVSVFARDVPGVRFEIGRVLPDQLHHWVTQGSAPMSSPSFSGMLDADSLAEFQVETRAISSAPGKPVYETLDLGSYLDPAGGKRGVFYLKVQSWDPNTKEADGPEDRRLILVSDLGVLAKRAADGSHSVFVQSIQTGSPVPQAQVQVLGRNGQPVASARTDEEGRAQLPSLRESKREKEPVMFLVTLGRDSSFLPYDQYDRTLDVSRFDVGGVYETGETEALSAYLFSDRGVYRPGDEFHIGIAVRKRDWSSDFVGLPLQATITDPRGVEVKKLSLKLGAAGFEEIAYRTQEVSPTGNYVINLFTVKDGYAHALLGSTQVQVREFLPDRMTIKARLSQESLEGWVSPKDLKAGVILSNLFGTPAAARRVRGKLRLVPGLPGFGQLRGYTFFDPPRSHEPIELPLTDTETDSEGAASFDLPLARYADATYRLSFVAEGFEAAGGRSVMAEASAVVSPLQFLIGWKADGNLLYLARDSKRALELIAVGPAGTRVAAAGLTAVINERKYVSTLVRQSDGRYKYESVRKEIERSRAPLSIAATGAHFALPTDLPGDYSVVLKNSLDQELQRIAFSVTGAGNLSRALDKNAELQIALKSADVAPGSEIELQIKAPYKGAGLITIERDKVYSAKWFKADTTTTIQTIKVPEVLEGGGYVSVAFIRDPGSDEVFMSPLSHGVVPFSISRAKRAIDLHVESADLAKPGKPYRMKVHADRPARAVVFAVDEGVLRVASYKPPDPLAHFFQKRALSVQTTQILDLILPEYERLLHSVAPGGDDEAKAIGANLNPFKRRRDKPVAYWSGLIDIGTEDKELSYDVPDTFNGALHVMAVAISPNEVGAFDRMATIRGDFTLTPNVPTFVAPGDEFEVSVGVANNVLGSGKKPEVQLSLAVSPQLELIGSAQTKLTIAEMRESSATFRLRARDKLGSATLTFETRMNDKRGKVATDLSVRPAAPYATTLQAGFLRDGKHEVPVPRKLFAEQRTLEAGISAVPLGLAHGLVTYLSGFTHACTEQVVSQGVPAIVLGKRAEFGFKPAAASAAVTALTDILRSRQNDDGGFGLWASNPQTAALPTVWALHALTDAKERGYKVPAELMKAGTGYLQSVAREAGEDLAAARLRSYAIYVLTRNAVATGSLASAARKYMEANFAKEVWQKDLMAAYLGASFRLLKQDALAGRMLEGAKFGQPQETDYLAYHDALAHDAQLLYLIARHFPEKAEQLGPPEIDAVARGVAEGRYNTFSSAFSIMALEAYAQVAQSGEQAGQRSVSEIGEGGTRPLSLAPGLLPVASFSDKARALSFSSAGDFGSYWLVTQRGFDLGSPAPESSKLEVVREYVGSNGQALQQVELGGEVIVRVTLRSPQAAGVPNIALVDLLPGGFEVVVQASAKPSSEPQAQPEPEGDDEPVDPEAENTRADEEPSSSALPIALPGSTFTPDYGDVREDRVVLYGTAEKDALIFEYAIKATSRGRFSVPPVQAESLYDRSVRARGAAGQITVK